MAIFKIHKEDNYTVLDNGIFKDKDLSLKALGLLCKMLSLPPDWDFSLAGLVAISKESTQAVRSALKELQDCGYVKITKSNNSQNGQMQYQYDIFETKQQTDAIQNPDVENPYVVNPSQLSTNTFIPSKDSIKDINKINNNIDIVEETSTTHKIISKTNKTPLENFRKTHTIDSNNQKVEEVIGYLNEVSGKKYKANTGNTVKLIVGRLREGYTVDDIKRVIDSKCKAWKGTDMEQYIRPSTLFRPSNFENYFNNLPKATKPIINTTRNTSNRVIELSEVTF